jgi:hypothetical protein
MLSHTIAVPIPKEKHGRSIRRARVSRREDLAEIRAALSFGTSGVSAFLAEVPQ